MPLQTITETAPEVLTTPTQANSQSQQLR